MTDITPQLKKTFEKARGVKLSNTEKNEMRARLRAYVASEAARPRAPILSPWVRGRFLVMMHKPVAFALLVVFVLSGGTAYAAEGALPGDALYPIKVDVVEEVRAALTVSDEGKMRWDAARVERRLEEAAALTSTGQLTDEKEQEIERRFDALAENIQTRAQKVGEEGDSHTAAIVLSEFEGTLRGHAKVLARAEVMPAPTVATTQADIVTESSAEPTPAVSLGMPVPPETPLARVSVEKNVEIVQKEPKIARKVRERLGKLERVREESEHKTQKKEDKNGGEKKAAENRIQDAEQALGRVEKALEDRPKRADVRARVNDARQRIQEARKNEDSGSSTEAFIGAQAAVRVIQESNVLLKVNDEMIVDEKTDGNGGINVEAKSEDGISRIEIKTNTIFNQNND